MTDFNKVSVLDEPKLEFGFRQQLEDPRNGLFLFGPINDHRKPSQIRAGVVGTQQGVSIFHDWLNETNRFMPQVSEDSRPELPRTSAVDPAGSQSAICRCQ